MAALGHHRGVKPFLKIPPAVLIESLDVNSVLDLGSPFQGVMKFYIWVTQSLAYFL